MEKILSMEALEQYRSMLPYRATTRICQKTGYCRSYVYKFLRGMSYNPEIEEAVLNEIINFRTKQKKLLKKAGIKE